jgi:hypothetical protein
MTSTVPFKLNPQTRAAIQAADALLDELRRREAAIAENMNAVAALRAEVADVERELNALDVQRGLAVDATTMGALDDKASVVEKRLAELNAQLGRLERIDRNLRAHLEAKAGELTQARDRLKELADEHAREVFQQNWEELAAALLPAERILRRLCCAAGPMRSAGMLGSLRDIRIPDLRRRHSPQALPDLFNGQALNSCLDGDIRPWTLSDGDAEIDAYAKAVSVPMQALARLEAYRVPAATGSLEGAGWDAAIRMVNGKA